MKRRTPRTGCTIGWQQKNIYKYAEVSMEDVGILLKNIKLDYLSIELLFSIGNESKEIKKKKEDLKKFYESMKSLLVNKRSQLLQTKKITLIINNLSEAAGLLECIDPKSLKCISLPSFRNAREAIEMDFSELEALEQWKNAERLEMEGNYILGSIESFASFKTISVYVINYPIEKLDEVKELFLRSPKMKKFIITSYETHEIKDQILSNFGPFDSHDEEFEETTRFSMERPLSPWNRRIERRLKHSTWTWLKNVPDSTEKLQIILNTNLFSNITFAKI